MAKKNSPGGLDLSGVGGKRLNIGGGAHHRPGLSFAGQSSSKYANAARQHHASKKAGGSSFSNASQVKSSGRTIATILLGIVLSVALAVGVGFFVYRQTVQNAVKPDLDNGIVAALSEHVDNEPAWCLLVVEASTSDTPSSGKLASLAFVCADTQNAKLSFVWVPSTLRAYVAGYGYMSLNELYETDKGSTFESACAELSGASFEHVFLTSQSGVSSILSDLDINDASDSATQSIAVAKKILSSSSGQQSSYLALLQKCVATDLSSTDFEEFVSQLKSDDVDDAVFGEDLPLEDGVTAEGYTQLKADDWATMRTRLDNGLDPTAGKSELEASSQTRSNTSVTIWNGVGVSGIAGDCANFIKKKGWVLESSGNAQSFVYDETLIVYNYDSQKKAAELLASDLGQGRVVPSAARYSFEGDVLIVIGKNYKPF